MLKSAWDAPDEMIRRSIRDLQSVLLEAGGGMRAGMAVTSGTNAVFVLEL